MTKPDIRLPDWFKVSLQINDNYRRVQELVDRHSLHTVCRGARCPNIRDCWNSGTATFMILGHTCTRSCAFCGVPTAKKLTLPDPEEPGKIAQAISSLGLSWAVLTSVTRDDLPDSGAEHFADCVRTIHRLSPHCGVELLIPDLKGDRRAIEVIINSSPQVIAHNVETVPRLYPEARPEADYHRSLGVLSYLARNADSRYTVKSSFLVGLGETLQEILAVISDLARAGCEAITIGQYLPPSRTHLPVQRFYTPDEFEFLAETAKMAGIPRIAAGPLVRSSYLAHKLAGKNLHSGKPVTI